MTPTACSLLLGLVLCSVWTWAAVTPEPEVLKIKIKPGTCPKDVNYPRCELDTMKKTSGCEWDGDCDGKAKCCYSGCSKRCLLPLEDKTGSCPYFNSSTCRNVKPFPDECHSDDQCHGSDRCCCFNCRRQCVPTERVKPGQCPAIKGKCPAKLPKPMCQKDSDCTGNKKCCKSCGNKCVDPETERAGFCPVIKEQLPCSTVLGAPLCSTDSQCPRNQKCCVSGNKMQCVKALKEKPGDCPVPTTSCAVNPSSKPKCTSDKQCPGIKKCCTPKCGQECTDPIIVKPGTCPVLNTFAPCTAPFSLPLCQSDINCPEEQKCCDYGCERKCVVGAELSLH